MNKYLVVRKKPKSKKDIGIILAQMEKIIDDKLNNLKVFTPILFTVVTSVIAFIFVDNIEFNVEIIQTYLQASNGQELRIRQRGDGKNFVYTKTRKWKVNDIKRVEFESRISKEEYLSLLMDIDTTRTQIRKSRYCFVYKSFYLITTRKDRKNG